jgi:hypothetical protein
MNYINKLIKDYPNNLKILNIKKIYENNLQNLDIIKLYQSDFTNGTFRIKNPGNYILQENIIFNPNESNNFQPTEEQIKNNIYPVGIFGPYHLGFFAAIAIESDNVIINLNGYTIKQSYMHHLMQRFYSHIEFGNSPFINFQGPHKFTNNFKSVKNCIIMNGKLIKSSHHGIHGNFANNVAILDLIIEDFEVAGIALNGFENTVLSDIICNGRPIKNNMKVLSSFSQSINILNQLKNKLKQNNNFHTITINNKILTLNDIVNNLQKDIDKTIYEHKNNLKLTIPHIANTDLESDGNMYGILLHVKGIAINDFITERTEKMCGNKNIFLNNIIIKNIISSPKEIITLNTNIKIDNGYSKKAMTGPFGDAIDFTNISKNIDNKLVYQGNSLSDAQFWCSKLDKMGTTSIPLHMIEWVEKNLDLNKIIKDNSMYYLCNTDSMVHLMKGNIGLFNSGGINTEVYNISFENLEIKNHNIGKSTLVDEDEKIYTGSWVHSIISVACKNIKYYNIEYLDKYYDSFPKLS